MKQIYLDHNATTPIIKEVADWRSLSIVVRKKLYLLVEVQNQIIMPSKALLMPMLIKENILLPQISNIRQ